MIKPNELRLGNLFYAAKDGYRLTVKIKGIKKEEVNTALFEVSIKDLQGIPLTAEWLDKFGLARTRENIYRLHNSRFEIHLFPKEGEHLVSFNGYNLVWIKYVHQLQNLVFDLTGEELSVRSIA